MPKVGDKHFPYTAAGEESAKDWARKHGGKVEHGKGGKKSQVESKDKSGRTAQKRYEDKAADSAKKWIKSGGYGKDFQTPKKKSLDASGRKFVSNEDNLKPYNRKSSKKRRNSAY